MTNVSGRNYEVSKGNEKVTVRPYQRKEWWAEDSGTTQEESRKAWHAEWLKAKREDAMGLGENYLSADYRRINPLLAALEAVGFVPGAIRNPDFSFEARRSEVLTKFKFIAVERKYTDAEAAASWDDEYLNDTFAMVRQLLSVWTHFPQPNHGGDTAIAQVYRGDSAFLFNSFPELDPNFLQNGVRKYKEGANAIDINVTFPGFISTTYGDPKEHNYVKGKKIVWDISLPEGHEGKQIGKNNPSEKEITFPVGTTFQATELLVRLDDKSVQAGKYGTDADVVITATAKVPKSQ